MKNDYVLGNHSNELVRLQIQAAFFESMAQDVLQKAGIRNGLECLDVGCGVGSVSKLLGDMVGSKGRVVGIDVDEKYVAYCKKNNKRRNTSFLCADITKGAPTGARFDIIYSRFMFVHLKDRVAALESMIQMLKKGGVIVIQELDHAPNSWMSYPKSEAVARLQKIYVALIRRLGGDPLAGRKLYGMFLDLGLDSSVECYSPCLVMGKKPFNELGWRIAQSMRPMATSLGIASDAEYAKLMQDLKALSLDRQSFVVYARIFSVIGKKR